HRLAHGVEVGGGQLLRGGLEHRTCASAGQKLADPELRGDVLGELGRGHPHVGHALLGGRAAGQDRHRNNEHPNPLATHVTSPWAFGGNRFSSWLRPPCAVRSPRRYWTLGPSPSLPSALLPAQ